MFQAAIMVIVRLYDHLMIIFIFNIWTVYFYDKIGFNFQKFSKIVILERHRPPPTYGLKNSRPRRSCRPLKAWYEVRISKLNYKMNVSI